MPEVDFEPESFEDEVVEESASEASENLREFTEAQKKYIKDIVKKETQEILEKISDAVVKANVKVLNDLLGKNGMSPLTSAEAENLREVNDSVSDLQADPTNPQSISNFKTATEKMTPKTQSTLNAAWNGVKNVFKTKAQKLNTNIDGLSEGIEDMANSADKLEAELKKPDPDPAKVKALQDEITSKYKNLSDSIDTKNKSLAEKIKGLSGEDAWRIFKALLILGGIGTGIWALFAYASAQSGCYMYYNPDGKNPGSVKLEGCSDYYKKTPDTMAQCSCGNLVDVGTAPMNPTSCRSSSYGGDCTHPYCASLCDGSISGCSGWPVGLQNMQCTNVGIADKGDVFYSIKIVTPLSLIASAIDEAAKLPAEAVDSFFDIVKKILLYGGIGIGALLVAYVLYILIQKFSQRSSGR